MYDETYKNTNVEFSGDSYKVKHSNENLPIIPNNNKKYSSKLMKRGSYEGIGIN